MLTVLEIIKRSTDFLASKGVAHARLNAEHLVGHVLGLGRMQLYLQFERPMPEAELERVRSSLKRRARHEPLQYIVGETDFFGVRLKLDRRALIPRPETEHLLDLLTRRMEAAPTRIIDLGTGSGAIALGLAKHYPEALVWATDISPEATRLAEENAVALGLGERVRVLVSDWFSAVEPEARFDLIVSNPPYLSRMETEESPEEVREFEPTVALTPGETGLEAMERLVPAARAHLRTGGWFALETGIAQHGILRQWLERAGFSGVESVLDLSDRPRYLLSRG